MKKRALILIVMVAVLSSFAIMPAFAATFDKVFAEGSFSAKFDELAATTTPFSDTTKPAGFDYFVGGGDSKTGMIISDGVGGRNSLVLLRVRPADGGNESANARFYASGIDYTGAEEIAVSFAFRYETLGDYGFTVLIGTSTNPDTDWGQGSKNLFAIRTENGKAVINVQNGGDSSTGGTLKVIKDDLKANTDYVVTAIFKAGTNNYDVAVNGTIIGSYTYFEKVDAINSLRIDDHGYNDGGEHADKNVCFNDIQVGKVVAKDSTSAPTGDPTTTPTKKPDTPNTNTGDSTSFIGIAAMAIVAVTVVMKKKVRV